jgi:hypothetical protein
LIFFNFTQNRDWEDFFVKETMAPSLTTSRAILENNVPLKWQDGAIPGKKLKKAL